jgi:hypothetical protein
VVLVGGVVLVSEAVLVGAVGAVAAVAAVAAGTIAHRTLFIAHS